MNDDTIQDTELTQELATLGVQIDSATATLKKDVDELSTELDTHFAATDKALEEFVQELETGEEEV